jgi:hypothetical protein
MPANTPIYGFPYPLGTDPVTNGAQDIQDLATAVESTIDSVVGLFRITTCTATFVGGSNGSVSDGVITMGSNNTAVTISNAFSSDYENYKIVYSGGVASTNLDITLRLGSQTSAYFGAIFGARYDQSTTTALHTNNGASLIVGTGQVTTAAFNVEVLCPNISTRGTQISSSWLYRSSSLSYAVSIGECTATASFTAFTVATSTGSLTGGKIAVYGYNI